MSGDFQKAIKQKAFPIESPITAQTQIVVELDDVLAEFEKFKDTAYKTMEKAYIGLSNKEKEQKQKLQQINPRTTFKDFDEAQKFNPNYVNGFSDGVEWAKKKFEELG